MHRRLAESASQHERSRVIQAAPEGNKGPHATTMMIMVGGPRSCCDGGIVHAWA